MPSGRDRKLATHYVSRGKQHGMDRQYREALESLQEAVRLDPTSADAWILLALTHYRLHEFGECLGAVDEALTHDSDNQSAWNLRGLALLALGRPAEALAQFSYAAEHWSHPHLAVNAGAALHDLRRYSDALAWIDRAVALEPLNPLAVVSRVYCLLYLERYEEAETQLASAGAIASGQSTFWAAKGLLHTYRGEYDEAVVEIKRAIDLSGDDDDTAIAYERMGELLIALEDHPRALEFAEHGLELCPHSYDGLMLKAKALRGLERKSEADEIERTVQARLAEQLALLDQAEGANR